MAKYRVQLNLADVNDSRSLAVARVPPGSRVLDVGIGDGTVGRTLRSWGCSVWGVEYDKALADESRDVYEQLVEGDVEELDLLEAFGSSQFDVVLLLDVLEHLRSPATVLERAKDLLSRDGFVVISLPNVTHAAVKLGMLRGQFSYTEEGLLDATHLRFFDLDHVMSLLDAAGFEMFDLARVVRGVDQTEIEVDLGAVPEELVKGVLDAPESETYQFVLTAAPRGSALLDDPPVTQATMLQREVSRLRKELAALQAAGGSRPDESVIEFIDDRLARLHDRSINDQRALRELVASFNAMAEMLGE